MEFLAGINIRVLKGFLAAIIFFVCAVVLHKNKKEKEQQIYEKLSNGTKGQSLVDYENELKGNMPLRNEWEPRNHRDAEDLRGGMGAVLIIRYLDWICVFAGILMLALTWGDMTDNPYKDVLIKWVVLGIVIVVCILVGVMQYLRADIGKETKKITGKVVRVRKKMRGYGDYCMIVMWIDEQKRFRFYHCPYNFRKHNRPKVGSEYELLYSYKYDNVKTKDEIRQGRRYSFYAFGLAVFWLIIGLVNLTL